MPHRTRPTCSSPGGGQPNPGLLPVQFTAGDKPGRYQPTVEVIGGNSYRFTLIAE